jgi:hypothetical protein
LVVDAMGRRSAACEWILSAGGRSPVEEAEDSNFAYFTRYFSGHQRPKRTGRALTPMGLFSILTLDGDNDTWSVTLYTSSKNKAMRALRDTATFHRVVSACPRQAHWLEGEPITPVFLMAGVLTDTGGLSSMVSLSSRDSPLSVMHGRALTRPLDAA